MRSTTARGYGNDHMQERKRVKAIVDAGQAWCKQPVCLYPNRWIPPGSRWALGHNDDRTAWIGPTHFACNQRDGASKGGKARAGHIINTCQACGTHFKAWSATQRYCSHACRNPEQPAASRITACEGCHTPIASLPHGRPRKWCSNCVSQQRPTYRSTYRSKQQQKWDEWHSKTW